jgi:hypothetical protein
MSQPNKLLNRVPTVSPSRTLTIDDNFSPHILALGDDGCVHNVLLEDFCHPIDRAGVRHVHTQDPGLGLLPHLLSIVDLGRPK